MTLYLIRHAEARHNLPDPAACPYDPRFEPYEHRDHSLTPQGERQADLTGRLLRELHFDAALVSPYHRTIATAAAIMRYQRNKIPFELLSELEECGSDTFTMLPEALAKSIYPHLILPQTPTALGKESDHERWLRAERVAASVRERYRGTESVLIVSHGHFLSSYLTAAFLGLSEEKAAALCLGARNAAVTRIQYTDTRIILDTLNESVHIAPLRPLE